MKYLCLAYYDIEAYAAYPPAEMESIIRRCGPLDRELRSSGQLRAVASLVDGSVMTIRHRDGATGVTDGPFVETKEQVGSFFLVEARDLNDAVRVASKHPAANIGEELGWAVEVRPIEHYEEL